MQNPTPITVAYGSKESPEFQGQGRTFAAALKARSAPAKELILDGLNHFEGIRSMIEPQSPLARQVLSQIGLASAWIDRRHLQEGSGATAPVHGPGAVCCAHPAEGVT